MKYNPYPEIKLPFSKDNRWFAYLFDSILRVDSSFIEYTIKVKEGGELCNSDTIAHLERVFAYELYRQWMNCLEKNGVKNLVVNGEVGKYLKNELETCEPNDKKGKEYSSLLGAKVEFIWYNEFTVERDREETL